MDHLKSELDAAVRDWDGRGWPRPKVLVIAGSGLSVAFEKRLAGPMPWSELVPFPVHGIEGHPLELELLEPTPGRVVLYSRGRIHAYQGFTAAQVVFPVRLAALLGAELLVLTNSSGGLHPHHQAGDLMAIRDQLNLSGLNPLTGEPPPEWGPRFPDMSEAYSPAFRAFLLRIANELGFELAEGVYVGLHGPSYETPAEVAMLRGLGGDAVGMSTVLETIAARHMGLAVAGLSMISNPGAGLGDERLDHADVLAQGQRAATRVKDLLETFLTHPDLLP